MDSQSRSKINRLLTDWSRGTVAVQSWLSDRGVYRQLVEVYHKTGWLNRIGRGAFTRMDDRVDWTGGLYAIQEQMRLKIHAGGKTALQMHGYAHFLPLGKGGAVSLFGPPGEKLPAWFRKYDWGANIQYMTTGLFSDQTNVGLTKKETGSYVVTVSSPERAIMEVVFLVPQKESFEEATLLMEGLRNLRPRLVQNLLEQCQSVKVKRLFMLLAENCNHPWVKKLDLSRVHFGKGKRSIVKGGRLDPKYNITVPGNIPETGNAQRKT
jgi:hypothetical protein